MPLSDRSLDLLIDLVQNKMTGMLIADRDDAREFVGLQRCHAELTELVRGTAGPEGKLRLPEIRRRGRPPKIRPLAI